MSVRPEHEQAWRSARREASRVRRARRRRRVLLGVLVVALAGLAALAVALLERGGGGAKPRATGTTDAALAASQPARHVPVRRARRRRPGTEPVPILMYHVIAPPLASAPYPGLYVPPAEFKAQMQALARAGYHAVTLDQVRAYWLHGTPLPRKPVVLSFDNGYRTQYTEALPILRALHWVGDENLQLSGLPPSQGGLSAREVRLLVAAGWELDTQGFSHADLPDLDAAELRYQVAVARSVIRRRFGVRADWFCYPSGQYDPTVVAAVKAAGYVGSTTVVAGWADRDDDPYRLERLRVLGGTDPAELLALIAGTRGNGAAPQSYLTSS